MLYTKIQPQSFIGSGEEYFQVSFTIYGYGGYLLNGVEPFEQIVNIPLTEDPM